MTYLLLLLKNEIFYLSLFFVFLICYSIDSYFSKNKRKKSDLFFFLCGTLMLVAVLLSTISQYSTFKTLAIHDNQQTTEECEYLSTNRSLRVDLRLDAVRKFYVNTGKNANYLNVENELTSYVATTADKKQRLMRLQEDEVLTRSEGVKSLLDSCLIAKP